MSKKVSKLSDNFLSDPFNRIMIMLENMDHKIELSGERMDLFQGRLDSIDNKVDTLTEKIDRQLSHQLVRIENEIKEIKRLYTPRTETKKLGHRVTKLEHATAP